MNNIMLDLESMGKDANAAIIAIGAVRFDTQIRGEFYTTVNLQSCVDLGLTTSPDTILWWLEQSDAARAPYNRKKLGVHLSKALIDFRNWIDEDAIVWGNGADFDNTILKNAYEAAKMGVPWKFRNNRCYRTIKSLHRGIKLERVGVHHNAVDDAISQAKHLIKLMTSMGLESQL